MNQLITAEELHRRLGEGEKIALVDVRSKDAYQEGHIHGAINIPRAELERRMGDIPRDRPVVTY